MTSLMGAWDGGGNTVGSTPHTWVLTDHRAQSPNFTSDVMLSALEVSCDNPSAVLEIRIGRVELSENIGGSGAFYFRGALADDNLPGWAGPITSFNLHQTIASYFLSGGHPLQLSYDSEELEAIKNAEGNTDQAVAVWIKRSDDSEDVGYRINARFEVNK